MVAINKKVQDDSYEDRINQEHRQYIEVIYECDNLVQNPPDVDFYDQFMEWGEDDKKKKDLCYSSTFQSGKCKVKSKLEFSKEDLHPISHIVDDTPNLQLLIILDCDTKFRKYLKVQKKKNFTLLSFLAPNPYGLKKKRVPKYHGRKLILQDEQHCSKSLPMFGDLINSRLLRNGSRGLNLCETSRRETSFVVYGLPKVKIR